MILLDLPIPKGHLSLVAVSPVHLIPSADRVTFKNADEVDYRWLWFVMRVERYKV